MRILLLVLLFTLVTFGRATADSANGGDSCVHFRYPDAALIDPSEELIKSVLSSSDDRFNSKIAENLEQVVWKEIAIDRILACVPDSSAPDEACGELMYVFVKMQEVWIVDEAMFMQCH